MSQEPTASDRPEKLLKAVDVAEILNISRALSYQLLQNGDIPTVRINRAVRVRPTDLEGYIRKRLNRSTDNNS
jgi:excisionase family DNA binding protein